MVLQVRGFPCDCSFADNCDSQSAPLPTTRLAEKQIRNEVPKFHDKSSDSSEDTSSDACNLKSNSSFPTYSRDSLKELESRHVVDVYDAIASHFSATRSVNEVISLYLYIFSQLMFHKPTHFQVCDMAKGKGLYIQIVTWIYTC